MVSQLLYIAGPYTLDPVLCSRAAILTATEVYRAGEYIPMCPHLTLFWHTLTPMEYEHWLAIDLAVIERCHAIMRLPGPSNGADREVEHAYEHGLLVVPFEAMPDTVQAPWRSLQRMMGWRS